MIASAPAASAVAPLAAARPSRWYCWRRGKLDRTMGEKLARPVDELCAYAARSAYPVDRAGARWTLDDCAIDVREVVRRAEAWPRVAAGVCEATGADPAAALREAR
jgi:hypothetical protein